MRGPIALFRYWRGLGPFVRGERWALDEALLPV